MSCDACKRIPVLTKRPCGYCGRLNVEAELAREQLNKLRREPAELDRLRSALAASQAEVARLREAL